MTTSVVGLYFIFVFFRVLYHLGTGIEKLAVGKENDIAF